MKKKTVLGFIIVLAIYIVLVTASTLAVAIPLMLLGELIGVGNDIFVYVALFFITLKIQHFLGWIADKIGDRIERKKEREYFDRLNKKI